MYEGPKNCSTFSFNYFVKLVLKFKAITSASHKLMNLNREHPLKIFFLIKFLSNRGYVNFFHRNATATKLCLFDLI